MNEMFLFAKFRVLQLLNQTQSHIQTFLNLPFWSMLSYNHRALKVVVLFHINFDLCFTNYDFCEFYQMVKKHRKAFQNLFFAPLFTKGLSK